MAPGKLWHLVITLEKFVLLYLDDLRLFVAFGAREEVACLCVEACQAVELVGT